MRIGVDSSVIVAAVHANHPLHLPSAHWLNRALEDHDVIVAHHTLLESYSALTRLPARYRLTPAEAATVLAGTLRENVSVAAFAATMIWDMIDKMAQIPVFGGAAYDAFIVEILTAAGVDCIATYNAKEFRRLSRALRIVDPLE